MLELLRSPKKCARRGPTFVFLRALCGYFSTYNSGNCCFKCAILGKSLNTM